MKFAVFTSTVALLCGLPSALAIYEKNKGANEWRIENIGDIEDVSFLEKSP
jgi:hypothetical protein